MNYTKREWRVYKPVNGSAPEVWDGTKDCIAKIRLLGGSESYSEAEANAYLIAAAPDMYEALRAILANIKNELRITDNTFGHGMFVRDVDLKKYTEAITEVIAKVEDK